MAQLLKWSHLLWEHPPSPLPCPLSYNSQHLDSIYPVLDSLQSTHKVFTHLAFPTALYTNAQRSQVTCPKLISKQQSWDKNSGIYLALKPSLSTNGTALPHLTHSGDEAPTFVITALACPLRPQHPLVSWTPLHGHSLGPWHPLVPIMAPQDRRLHHSSALPPLQSPLWSPLSPWNLNTLPDSSPRSTSAAIFGYTFWAEPGLNQMCSSSKNPFPHEHILLLSPCWKMRLERLSDLSKVTELGSTA